MLRATLIFISILVSQTALAWNTPGLQKMGNTNLKWLWTGAGGDSLWTNGANWCGTFRNGVCEGASSGPPTSGAAIFFDGTCVANGNNCSPTGIPAGTFTFTGIHMRSGFTGTIAFGATNVTVTGTFILDAGTFSKSTGTLTASNFKMTGGTFNGGSGPINFNTGNGTAVVMSGGDFTSTTGLMTIFTEVFNLTGLNSFSHASGSISIQAPSNNSSIYPGGFTWNTVTFKACNRTNTLYGDVVLDGNLYVTVSGSSGCQVWTNGYSIELKSGNYYKQGGIPSGTTTFKFTGNGQQWIDTTGTNNGYNVHPVIVAQGAAGSIKFNGRADLLGWDDTATLGSIDYNSQVIGIASGTFNSTAYTWPSLTLLNSAASYTAFTNLSATDLVLAATSTGIGSPTGEIKVLGNVTAGAGSLGSSGKITISMCGAGAQNIDLTAAATQYFPLLKVDKLTGSLSVTGDPYISGGFNYVQGTFTQPSHVYFGNGTSGASVTIASNGYHFNNVSFGKQNGYTFSDDMFVDGDLAFENTTGASWVGPGLVRVTGNVSATAGAVGYSSSGTISGIKLDGANRTMDFSLAGAAMKIPGIHFAGSGVTTVTGSFAVHSTAGGTLVNHASGTVDATGSSVTFSSTGAPAWTFAMGTIQWGNVTLLDNASHTLNGSTMTVNGSLALTEISAGRSYNGPIVAYGDVSYNTWGVGGSHPITFKGANSTFSAQAGVAVTGSSLTIAKNPGQKVSLGTNYTMTAGTSMYITSGGLDLSGHNLTLSGGGALNLFGTTLTLSSGTLTIGGATINPGPYSGGMIDP